MITIATPPTQSELDEKFINKNLEKFPKYQHKLIKLCRRHYINSNIDLIFAEFLSGKRPFFTTSSSKFVKSAKMNINVVGLALAHSWVSGRNVCPWAIIECIDPCIGTTGVQNHTKKNPMLAGKLLSSDYKCKLDRTKLFFEAPEKFEMLVEEEVLKQYRISKAMSIVTGIINKTGIRLNTTSDLKFYKLILKIIKKNPEILKYVLFYDYTKGIPRIESHPKEYDLSYSYNNNTTISDCFKVLKSDHNIVIVLEFMKKSEYPFSKITFSENGKSITADLISGDDHDLRGIDPKSNHAKKSYKVVYLKQKKSGLAGKQLNKDNSFFLDAENPPEGIQIHN